jgi:hypothetical protein
MLLNEDNAPMNPIAGPFETSREGIYILANDVVYDQLIALINSIRVNSGQAYPICVIPYDGQIERVRALLATDIGLGIMLFDNQPLLETWETFATQIWQCHPTAYQTWAAKGITGVNRMGMHRRFCGFDGPFERFIYLDADTLVLGSLAPIFAQLETHDVVVYDFQYKDPSHVFNVHSPKLYEVFPPERVNSEIFCAGMYAAKRGLFGVQQRQWLLEQLGQGDAEILYINGPDQTILNYMVMKTHTPCCNLARLLPPDQVTGCCVTSPHFEQRDYQLFDRGNPLTYMHFIGMSSKVFTRLCQGENLTFPYRDVFLHYRYLKEPQQYPAFIGPAEPYNKQPPPPTLQQKILKKIGLR